MFTANRGRLALFGAVAVGAVVALAGCATGDPLATGSGDSASETLIVGSQDYYSNEIIAEIYSQALEDGGYTVDRQFRIGQREVYLPDIEAGGIDVFPEYTGSLLQALEPDAAAGTADDVYTALESALPDGLSLLDRADASDQNSWTVSKAFAEQYGLTDIASLANVTEPITVGGNSELEERPYNPEALTAKYGIEFAGFTPIEDGGGPLTVKALLDGDIQITNIYTASPAFADGSIVALDDPDNLFLPDNVVPVVSDKVDDGAADILNAVSAALTEDVLVTLNARSSNDQESADKIATDWLAEANL
ncbi:ABC transporter substrate-binding protein [Cryobacterium melibiosiphilum]|uniref:ABC transporter substrate-binding protein n=1 Tax=Cryobacterium melibiosiphilum TaxID=995039 RepID=A0A3A5MLR1_9MICO|nr:ABC transporter substrate-binding protein [Cryobacterium melibiosiphilum]RJT88789.1 ABC transporter substrate-binding protein [Cryobacterium melibiosiphilum]